MSEVALFTSALPFGYQGDKLYLYITWNAPAWAVPGVTNYIFYITRWATGTQRTGSWQSAIDIHKAVLQNPDDFRVNPHVTKQLYFYALVPRGQIYHLTVEATNDVDSDGWVHRGLAGYWSVTSPVLTKDFIASEN